MTDTQTIKQLTVTPYRRTDNWAVPEQSGSTSSAGDSVLALLQNSFNAFYTASIFQEHPTWIPDSAGEAHRTKSEFATSQARIESKLRDLFVETPIEAGHSHPGESFLADLIERHYADVSTWIQSSIEAWPEAFAAALLDALSRIERKDARHLALSAARLGLRSPNLEVRDAAARALEQIGGPTAKRLLTEHTEKEEWLADYIQSVIEDLSDNGE